MFSKDTFYFLAFLTCSGSVCAQGNHQAEALGADPGFQIDATLGAGQLAAQTACVGFLAGAFKCLTDVAFVVCPVPGNKAALQYVQPGSRCAQGVVSQIPDHFVSEVASTTRIYFQNYYDPKASPWAQASTASSPAASSPAAASSTH